MVNAFHDAYRSCRSLSGIHLLPTYPDPFSFHCPLVALRWAHTRTQHTTTPVTCYAMQLSLLSPSLCSCGQHANQDPLARHIHLCIAFHSPLPRPAHASIANSTLDRTRPCTRLLPSVAYSPDAVPVSLRPLSPACAAVSGALRPERLRDCARCLGEVAKQVGY